MFDNLLNLVKEHAGEAIINNPAIPNDRNDEALATTSKGILDSLKNQVGSGGLDQITNLFSGGGNLANNDAVKGATDNVAQELMKKFGLDSGAASNIVSSLIPTVMNQLVNKTNDPNDNSFDLGDIIKTVGGGNAGGIGGMISNLFGK